MAPRKEPIPLRAPPSRRSSPVGDALDGLPFISMSLVRIPWLGRGTVRRTSLGCSRPHAGRFPRAIAPACRLGRSDGLGHGRLLRRHSPRHRCSRDDDRQGPQAEDHPDHQADRRSAPCLARRTGQSARRTAVPNQHRQPAHPQGARPKDRHARRARRGALPVPDCQDDLAAHPAPHRRDAAVARRRRYDGDALWLGHEQVETTQMYLHADLAIKERALARTKPLDSKPGRYRN